jgi:hypothetical protein
MVPTPSSEYLTNKLNGSPAPMVNGMKAFRPKNSSLELHPRIINLIQSWYEIVQYYGTCNITKVEDRLPAIAGIAKRISELTGFSYAAGLWIEDTANTSIRTRKV